jgi:hypothetical protein
MSGIYTPEQLGIKPPAGGFQTGGWYQGRQYWNGTFSDPGVIHPWSNQQGAGQAVSQEVKAQSAAAQGVSLQQFNDYLDKVSVANIQAPVTPSYITGSTQNYVSGLNAEVEAARKALEQRLAQDQAQTQAELEAAKKREAEAVQGVSTLTTPFRETLEKTERERLGTDVVLSQQRQLLDELDQLLTEGNQLIRQQKEVTGLAAIRNPRIQKTMDDIAARAGVINAVVSLQNTYLANAYQSIDRSVNAIAQDRKDRLAYYDTVLNLANRDIINLDNKSQEVAKEQINLLKFDLEQTTKTADYIKQLMVNPDTALLLAQSGVTLNDSIETVNKKLADVQYANEVRDLSNKMSTSGYVAVVDPKSVPQNQLITITDSKGNKYYYRKAVTGESSFDTTSFLRDKLREAGYKVSGGTPTTTETKIPQVNVDLIWDEVFGNSIGTMAGAPAFSPAGGVGTVWKDSTGKKWIYTVNGWKMTNS